MVELRQTDVDRTIPTGYTYLSWFVDHDLTRDATISLEFSVAAFRLGHSTIRESYERNTYLGNDSAFQDSHLFWLFRLGGAIGILPPAGFAPESAENLETRFVRFLGSTGRLGC